MNCYQLQRSYYPCCNDEANSDLRESALYINQSKKLTKMDKMNQGLVCKKIILAIHNCSKFE